MKELKTLKLSELIALLTAFKKEIGDVPVFHQTDPEGNSFGTLAPRSFWYDSTTNVGKALFIMPFEEHIDEQLWHEEDKY